MGFSIYLYSSERRSLIYWRVPCAAAAARCAADLVPFTAPLRLRPMSVAAAGVFSPSALARGTLALFLHISFFKLCSVTAIFLL